MAGETVVDAFAAVGDDWDVEERARAWLDRLGLAGLLGLDDRVERLSGGETIGVALAALFLRRPGTLLLDEPTNNLDLDARRRLYEAVAGWTGVMMIVSHDRELLGLVDQIADLSGGKVRMYGGNLAAYSELMAVERESAQRAAPRPAPRSAGNGGTSSTLRSSRLPVTDRAGRSPPHAACPGPSPMLARSMPRSPRAGRANCTPSAWRQPVAV